jgi:hypothetical protein
MGLGRKPETRKRSLPTLETLEGRAVPATFHVANVAQLAAAVESVNNTPGPNTILLRAGNYQLSGPIQLQNTGDLTIKEAPNQTAGVDLIATVPGRVLEIDGGNVTLSRVAITGGNGVNMGGGILAQGANLTLQDSSVTSNSAGILGGGIFIEGGTLSVQDSVVSSNIVGGGTVALGGGIAAENALVTISDSTVNNNSVNALGTATQSQATAVGGGIFTAGGSLNLTGSRLIRNTVVADTNAPSAVSLGGAIATNQTSFSITRGLLESNTVNTIAKVDPLSDGSAFATVGNPVNVTGTTFTANKPGGKFTFFHPGTKIVFQSATIDGNTISGTFPGDGNGSTPGG